MESADESRGFLSEKRFDREAFRSPASGYAPVYTWMWNAPVTKEETDRELEEMRALGIKRLYILPMPKSFRPTSFPTPLSPSYLSDDYFDAYRYAAEKAKALEFSLWLYDEGGWPSGGACGQVMLENPSLVSETVRAEHRTVKKGECYRPSEKVETATFEGEQIETGFLFPKEGELIEYRRVSTSFPHVNSADLPDITKPGATELFLKTTHDKYARTFGALPEKGFTALFTDEPTAPRPFPYTDEIKALFREKFGKEIEDCLPFLMGKQKATGKNAEIKIKFYDLLSRLFCDRFLEKEKAWAKEHGLLFLGHLDKDDEAASALTGGHFGLLRALRVFDVPGVDAIRRQIFPPKGRRGLQGENKFFPRYASSAAAQTGGRHALTESFAVYGCGLSYDEMRYVINFQAMRGINLFNLMLIPYGRKGYLQAGLLPHFTAVTHPDLAVFNAYAARLSYLFSLGERVVPVALFDPVADVVAKGEGSASCEKAGQELEQRRISFDLIDDDFLSFARCEEGQLKAGRAAYHTVILPSCDYLSDESLAALSRFSRAGGEVLCLSQSLAAKIEGARLVTDFSSIKSPLELSDAIGVTLAEARTEDGSIFFLMNESGEDRTVTLPASNTLPYLIDPAEGSLSLPERKGDVLSLTLRSGELVALLFTARDLPVESSLPSAKITLKKWNYRKSKRLVISDETKLETLTGKWRSVRLGERDALPEKDFSGSAEYKCELSLPTGTKRAVLDLGKVGNAAEAFLSGVSLGVRIMPPYRFEIPNSLLGEKVELLVRLTNTPANEFERTDAFEAHRPWQLGTYLKEEREFHKDSLESGLFGEVTLFYE